MAYRAGSLLLLVLFAAPLFAIDLGHAEGSMVTDKKKTTLSYAYVMRKVHNDTSGKNDAVKIILTDKPLPDGANLKDIDYNFPEGILGVVVCIDKQQQPVHLVVQHPAGVYDGGWVEQQGGISVRAKETNGVLEGHLRCRETQQASVTYSFDADFNANVQ